MAPNGPGTAYPPPIWQITRVLANRWASRLLFTATLALGIGTAVALVVALAVDLVVAVVAVGFSTAANQLSRVGVCGFTGP